MPRCYNDPGHFCSWGNEVDIGMHAEAQRQIREMEHNVRSVKHKRMQEIQKAYFVEKAAGRVRTETISMDSEKSMAIAIGKYLKTNEYDVLLDRRKAVAQQKFECMCCGSDQIQLVSWQHQIVDLRCRKCKRKFIWESPV